MLGQLRARNLDVQLIVCVNQGGHENHILPASSLLVDVPPLATRMTDISRIIEEYALDALDALRARDSCFNRTDHEWVQRYAATSLSEIEKATLRCVAVRMSPNVCSAAQRLGMAPVSLSRWLGRREECGS